LPSGSATQADARRNVAMLLYRWYPRVLKAMIIAAPE
jgi:hypothetical protein